MGAEARYARTVDAIGEEGLRRLQRATVVVAGLGGVGSHAAMALARSGIGRLRLVDHDVLTESSLNRHASAGPSDVGRAKVEVLAEALTACRPDLELEQHPIFVDESTLPTVLGGPPDYVVDAIDSLGPKVGLLVACAEAGLPAVSSMGASSRSDPSALRVDDLFATSVCPLAKMVRKRLRRRGVVSGVTAVYSVEEPGPVLPPDLDEPRLERGRQRNRLPSLSTLPGIFGYALANEVILALARGHS